MHVYVYHMYMCMYIYVYNINICSHFGSRLRRLVCNAGAMHAYIAFNEKDHVWIKAHRQILCQAFTFKGRCPGKYVPFAESIQGAMNAAISTNTPSATAIICAKEVTEWFILEIAIPDDDALNLFQEGVLSRTRGGWRWHKDLHLAEVKVVGWILCSCFPIGMER